MFVSGIHSHHSFLEFQALLVPEAWASWERNAPSALHYGCIMPMPSLQLQEKTSLMQKSRGFGHRAVVSKICYNILYIDCAPVWLLQTKLLASVGWKWGCQPFSCRCSDVRKMWRIAERRFVVHVCLRNPFPPFLLELKASTPYSYQKLELPESSSTLHQPCSVVVSCPCLPCSCRRKPVSCRKAEGLVTELSHTRFVTYNTVIVSKIWIAGFWLCSQVWHVTVAK